MTRLENKHLIFPIGVQFYYEPPRPLSDLKHDIRVAKSLNINTLRFQISWCMTERIEGKLALDEVEALLEEADRQGLYAHVAIVMEQAPAWLWRKFPDCSMVYSTGERHFDPTQYRYPYDGKPGPCWDHPGARKCGERFIRKLIDRLWKYDNIIEWNVMQEIEFWPIHENISRPSTLGFCYCKHTLNQFRKWLKEKYGDLNALNRAWGTGYGRWEEVEPPRFYDRVPAYIDWKYFIDDIYTVERIRWKVKAIKVSDPRKRPVVAHVSKVLPGRGSDWRWAKDVDVFGSSCYPVGSMHEWDLGFPAPGERISREACILSEVLMVALTYDYIRCAAGKERILAAAEFQGGPKGGLSRIPSPEDIRRWILTALSSGIQELYFWNLRPEHFWTEAYGYGLLDAQGDKTCRAEEIKRLSHAINKYPELFRLGLVPRPQVAILINEDLWHFAQARGVASIHETYRYRLDQHLSYTIRGIYAMLWKAGIWVDFIEVHEMTPEKLAKYKVVILPFPIAIDDKILKSLKKYVETGGTLVCEACPGRHDRMGFARVNGLSPIAEEIFGLKHFSTKMIHEPSRPPKWTPTEMTYDEIRPFKRLIGVGSLTGHTVFPSVILETYKTTNGTPILLYDDKIAGVLNELGDGKAYLIGTLIGHGYMAYGDLATQKFLLTLLERSNVTPEKCGQLSRRRRIYKNEEAWFLFNMKPKKVIESISIEKYSTATFLENGTTVEKRVINIKLRPFEVKCIIME